MYCKQMQFYLPVNLVWSWKAHAMLDVISILFWPDSAGDLFNHIVPSQCEKQAKLSLFVFSPMSDIVLHKPVALLQVSSGPINATLLFR